MDTRSTAGLRFASVLALTAVMLVGSGVPAGAGAAPTLEISVEPTTGLTDGQVVSVSVTGSEPGRFVAVALCPAGTRVFFIDDCDFGSAASGFADENGEFDAQVPVSVTFDRALLGEVDCAAAPGTCVMAAGTNPDEGPEVSVPLTFVQQASTTTTAPTTTTSTTAPPSSTTTSRAAAPSTASPRFTG